MTAAIVAAAMTVMVAGSAAWADAPPTTPLAIKKAKAPDQQQARQQPLAPRRLAPVVTPPPEPLTSASPNAGFGTASAFSATPASGVTSNSQTLSPPVTISYSGTSSALQVTDSGTGKAIQANITNTGNNGSALYGSTVGAGAGLTGYNGGTKGPAGKFGVYNNASAQPGVFATTSGTGPAVLGTVTSTSSESAAIYGQNVASTSAAAYGVLGYGAAGGVYGQDNGSEAGTAGVAGFSQDSYGVSGQSTNGVGIFGGSFTSSGVYASSTSGDGVDAVSAGATGVHASGAGYGVYGATTTTDASGVGIYGYATGGRGINGVTDSFGGYGIYGEGTNGAGVAGIDHAGGWGVYGSSATGNAGMFDGPVVVNGTLTVGSTVYTSDRNLKTDFEPVDGQSVLARLDSLPVTSWEFKSAPSKRHMGPTAQDFHAAFGLAGDDDKHIDVADIAGVSLAAIQELHAQLKQKDRQIASQRAESDARMEALISQLTAQAATIAALQAATEKVTARMALFEQQREVNPAQKAALKSDAITPHGMTN